MKGQTELWALVALEGQPYEEARSGWLGAGLFDRAGLADLAASDDRRAWIARILMGWMDHGARYEALLTELHAEDVKAASRQLAGMPSLWKRYAMKAAKDHGPSILPLCWEVLQKHGVDWPAWEVIAFLRMMQAVPDPRSLEPLLAFLEGIEDDALAQSAGLALAALPRDLVASRLADAGTRNERVRARLAEVAEELREAAAHGRS